MADHIIILPNLFHLIKYIKKINIKSKLDKIKLNQIHLDKFSMQSNLNQTQQTKLSSWPEIDTTKPISIVLAQVIGVTVGHW